MKFCVVMRWWFGVFKMNVGVSKCLDWHIGVLGQPRNVESEVCNVGKAVSWAAVISQGLDFWAQPCQWIWYSRQCVALWQSCWTEQQPLVSLSSPINLNLMLSFSSHESLTTTQSLKEKWGRISQISASVL